MIDPDEIVTFNGEQIAIKDIPLASDRHLFGFGHYSVPGREVITSEDGTPWPYEPDTCPRADETQWTWIHNGTYLVCPGCGTDGT